jgi:hypothetical protein
MQSMAEGAVRVTAGGLLTDDVMTEVNVSTTLILNIDFRDDARCSG